MFDEKIMELSLVATFDELRRCQDVLTDGTAEIGMLNDYLSYSNYSN